MTRGFRVTGRVPGRVRVRTASAERRQNLVRHWQRRLGWGAPCPGLPCRCMIRYMREGKRERERGSRLSSHCDPQPLGKTTRQRRSTRCHPRTAPQPRPLRSGAEAALRVLRDPPLASHRSCRDRRVPPHRRTALRVGARRPLHLREPNTLDRPCDASVRVLAVGGRLAIRRSARGRSGGRAGWARSGVAGLPQGPQDGVLVGRQ